MFKICKRFLIGSYFIETLDILNNIYMSFIIRIFLFSELFIFLFLLLSKLYFFVNINSSIGFLPLYNTFSIDVLTLNYSSYFIFLILSLILLSIKSFFYSFYLIFNFNYNYIIFKDLIVVLAFLGGVFSALQYFEFLFQGFNFLDSFYYNILYSVLGLHFIHIVFGICFLILILIYV